MSGATAALAETGMPQLAQWAARGEAGALVTLIGVDGASPRPIGAEMAVSASGERVGYLSGGCLERAVALEAQAAIAEGRPRTLRYGQGSPFLDVALPCGSGIDVHVLPQVAPDVLATAARFDAERRIYARITRLDTGATELIGYNDDEAGLQSHRDGARFVRVYRPCLRLSICGAGPAITTLAQMAHLAGLEVSVFTNDDETADLVRGHGVPALPLGTAAMVKGPAADHPLFHRADPYSATVLMLHDPEWEAALLAKLLSLPTYYLGAIGSQRARAARSAAMDALGVAADLRQRLVAPAGVTPHAKTAPSLAGSVLADCLAHATAKGVL